MKYSILFKALRAELSLTQVEMADKLNTSQAIVSKIEAGKQRPSVDVFLCLVHLGGPLTPESTAGKMIDKILFG